MESLKLPAFDVRHSEQTIFCLVRKKWVALTPEEWVRQHFLNLLFAHLGYPRGLTNLEHSLVYFKSSKRSDIVVLDEEGNVFLLVECKAPMVKLDDKVLKQIAAYNKVLDAKYLAISNGLSHYVWKKEKENLVQLSKFPVYPLKNC